MIYKEMLISVDECLSSYIIIYPLARFSNSKTDICAAINQMTLK
jgi:hypothetical protein